MKRHIKTIANLYPVLLLIPTAACTMHQSLENNLGPNIIYVFPSQFRNMAMGFWNEPEFRDANILADPVHTPYLNDFAKEAMVSSCAMSNCPLSSPHRGSLLTGTYPHRSGISINCNSKRPFSSPRKNISYISDVLSQNGYDCAFIGKWHADCPTPNNPQSPGQYVNNNMACDAYTPTDRRHGFNFWDNEGKIHEPHECSAIHEARIAINFLKNENNQRDPKKPFFMMIAMNPPHYPYRPLEDCMEEDFDLYKGKSIDSLLIRPNADTKCHKAQSAKYYFSSVTGVDRAFGMILCELKDLGLDKNTIVVFTSDQGEMLCSHFTDETKNLPYNEAMNVPFLIRYPGHIRPRMEPFMISTPDIMPTLLGLANLQNSIPETVQGFNYARLLTESQYNLLEPPASALYLKNSDGKFNAKGQVISYFPTGRGIKTKDYTLALFIDTKNKLKKTVFFHDAVDPFQLNNLKLEQNAQEAEAILSLLGKELKRIGDPWFEQKILANLIPY